jgi:hypothetical protein
MKTIEKLYFLFCGGKDDPLLWFIASLAVLFAIGITSGIVARMLFS